MHAFNEPFFLGPTGRASTRKAKTNLSWLKQETVSGSGISWTIYKSPPRSRQITAPATHHWFFYRPDALPAAQPTASKHWRHKVMSHGSWVHLLLITVKKFWVVGCWRGYLSGARCRLAYGPADATVTDCLLLQWNPDWFTFLVPAHTGSPGKRAVKQVCVCVHSWPRIH